MSRVIFSIFMSFTFLTPGLIFPTKSLALDNVKAIIFVQKEFPKSLSRNSRVLKQVKSEIVSVLGQEFGLDILDETMASMDTYTDEGGRRDKAELAEIARRASSDIAIILQVTPYIEELRGFKSVRSQISMEAFFVDGSSRNIGLVDAQTEIPVEVRNPFKKPQITEAAAEASKDIAVEAAQELGNQIIAQLKTRQEKGGIYTLVFKKFKSDEVESILSGFSKVTGYVSHRQIKQTARQVKVEYRSSADTSRLSSDFSSIMNDMGLSATSSKNGTTFIYSKMRIRNPNNN